MIAYAPPAAVAAAPAAAPATLEQGFALARLAARTVSDPASVLTGPQSVEDKLAAIDALHSRIPYQPRAAQIKALDALAAAAASPTQSPAVRAKALTYLGYAMPEVSDEAARRRALGVLLAALKSPGEAIFALRGLGPAAHDLPKADEPVYQGALLDLLDGPAAGEERAAALIALESFAASRDDLSQRAPALVAQLDARLLAPIEADPAAFVRDPRGTPASREMAAAAIWVSARHRQSLGDPAPAERARALLAKLAELEPDPTAQAWMRTYRDAPPPKAGALTESTTRRRPSGRGEP